MAHKYWQKNSEQNICILNPIIYKRDCKGGLTLTN